MSGGIIRALAWSVAAVALLAAGWHLLGKVDYDTQPTAEVPSRPTVLPVNEADQALQEGLQWAQAHNTTQHSECKDALGVGLRAAGCHRHVTAQKIIPPLVRDGLTLPRTVDCVAAVHAHYEPQLQDMAEQGDHHAASVWARKAVDPLVRQCNNIDNLRILRDVHEPLGRLNIILARVRVGQSLSEADLVRLRREYPEVERFRQDPMRTNYLATAENLFALMGGRQKVFPLALPGTAREEQCAALAQQLAGIKKAFHQRLEGLAPNASAASTAASSSLTVANTQNASQDQILTNWARTEETRFCRIKQFALENPQ
ncbi:MAG: hypothetical protein H7293_10925 [Candidatus Saccharibacteria bacterium]|nr:hypothetical protein [Rhodoferax sp.]